MACTCIVVSDEDYERLIVEAYWNGEFLFLLNDDDRPGEPVVEFSESTSRDAISLAVLLECLQRASDRYKQLDGDA